MYDLDKIHSIIFAKELPYNGTPNDSAGEVGRYIAAGPRISIDALGAGGGNPENPNEDEGTGGDSPEASGGSASGSTGTGSN